MTRTVTAEAGSTPRERVENVRPVMAKVLSTEWRTGDLTLEQAQTLAGEIVADVLQDTNSQLKEFGEKSAVGRWKAGTENPNLARLIQRADARKAMAKALMRSVRGVRERTVFEIEETA